MTRGNGIRPGPDGIGVARDVWPVGAVLTPVAQDVTEGARSGVESSRKATKQATMKASSLISC